jgi:hypothetical protein
MINAEASTDIAIILLYNNNFVGVNYNCLQKNESRIIIQNDFYFFTASEKGTNACFF